MMAHGYGITGSLILISLGIGYLVCSDAKKQSGSLKTIGYVIGTAIIALSIIAGFYKLYRVTGGKPCLPLQYPMIQKSDIMQQGGPQKTR